MKCPKCGGPMWDNRRDKRNPKAPDFKCKDKDCTDENGWTTAVWLGDDDEPDAGQPAAVPPQVPPPHRGGSMYDGGDDLRDYDTDVQFLVKAVADAALCLNSAGIDSGVYGFPEAAQKIAVTLFIKHRT